MKKVLKEVIFAIYIIVAILVTMCLLSYNSFKVSEFGSKTSKTLVIVKNERQTPGFNNGDLIIVDKNEPILTGRDVFYYTTEDRKVVIETAKVNNIEKVTESQKTYELEGKLKISSDYVIGSTENVEVLPKVGKILEVLESKWGFLFLIILPVLLAFIYQITIVYSDIKESNKPNKKGKKNAEKAE